MRKKQFLAFMLAGSLVMGMMPTAVFAEEGVDLATDSISMEAPAEPVVASEPEVISEPAPVEEPAPVAEETPAPVVETPTEVPAEIPTEVPTEAPAQAPTEAPTEAPTQAPTEAPTDVPTQAPTEAPTDVPTQAPTEAPTDVPTQAPTEAPTDVPTQTPTEAPVETPDFSAPGDGPEVIIIDYSQNATLNTDGTLLNEEDKPLIEIAIGETAYNSLEEAIAAAPDVTDPANPVFTEIVISKDILSIANTINIPASKYISIVAGVEDVTIARAEGFAGDMFEVDGALNFATGEILGEDGLSTQSALMLDGTLSGFEETAAPANVGSLVYVDDGILGISDNVSLENNAAVNCNGGAIRSEAEGKIALMGGLITGNTSSGLGGGIYAEGIIMVQGAPSVFDNLDAAGDDSNIVLGVNSQIVITGALSEDAMLCVQSADPDTLVSAATPIVGVDPTITDKTIADFIDSFVYEGVGYEFGEFGNIIIEEYNGDEGEEPENPGDGSGGEADDPEPMPGEEAILTDSVITGLADAMYFYPEYVDANNDGKDDSGFGIKGNPYTYYSFQVEGAGMDNVEPVDGDTRWNPAYWSYSQNPTDEEKYKTWTLGTKSGISEAGTHTFYVFFNEEIFDSAGEGWTATGEVGSISHSYNSLKLFELKGVSYTWVNETTASVTFRTNKPAKYFVDWVERTTANQQQPNSSDESVYVDMTADTDLTITLRDLDAGKPINVYAYAIDNEGGIKRGILFQLDENKRPKPSTRAPYIPSVTESKVSGLENALEFYPNTFYPFSVVGAGTNNNDPVAGDVKWVPVYWSTSSNPSSSQKHTTWKIGAAAGISTAATYNMYVFYQKYTHNGTQWVATDTISPVAYQFKSAAIEITQTPTPGGAGGYYDEDGNYVSYEGSYGGSYDEYDPEYYEDDTEETGAESTSKNAVDTADNSPIGNMFAMLVASLMAGLYILFRKRRNEI